MGVGGQGSECDLGVAIVVVDGVARQPLSLLRLLREKELLSHSMYLLNCFRKSTPPQNRQLFVSISNSKRSLDDFVGELTF